MWPGLEPAHRSDVSGATVRELQFVKTTAIDGNVQTVAGNVDGALRKLLRNSANFDTNTSACTATPAGTDGRGHDGSKFCAGRFCAYGVGVGDIVANNIQIFSGSVQA